MRLGALNIVAGVWTGFLAILLLKYGSDFGACLDAGLSAINFGAAFHFSRQENK